jgi:hypothetical protein
MNEQIINHTFSIREIFRQNLRHENISRVFDSHNNRH